MADRDGHAIDVCPILRPGITKDEARHASAECRLRCRFRKGGRCECRVVEIRPPARA